MNDSWQDLHVDGEDNLGGLRLVRCAPIGFFAQLPGPTTGNLVEVAPNFLDSEADFWSQVVFTTDTARFSEKENTGTGGPQWACKVTGYKPWDSANHRAQLEDWTRYQWVVEAQDNNGDWRRIGDLRNPARLTVDFDTEGATTGARGYTLTWVWENDRPAPLVRINEALGGSYTVLDPGEVEYPGG